LSFDHPKNLPDGAYVYKSWTKNVQVQWASGDMPADNALPYFAGEFLVRKVNLRQIHPFAPGQEIVDRTLFVPFTYLAFRSVDLSAARNSKISYFNYVGSSWPNAMDFYSPKLYEIYTGVNIALESFLAFVVLYIGARFRKLWKNGYPAALFVGIFPFLIQQTYFTWTKSFCVAFALLAINSLHKRQFFLAGLLLALSYQIHPMALIFYFGIASYFALSKIKGILTFSIPFIASCIFWEGWVLYTHLKSDLIQQNLLIDQSITEHVFARITSIYNFINPSFLNSYPLVPRNLLNSWLISGFPLALFFFAFAFYVSRFNFKFEGDEKLLLGVSSISLLLSDLVESRPSVIQFFGGQLMISIILITTIRMGKSWKFYAPSLIVLLMGLSLWAYVVKPIWN